MLIKDIRQAFPVQPVPRKPLMEPDYLNPAAQGDEGATDYFSGRQWDALDINGLVYHSAALYMFTPQAHRYYLPAFMLAALEFPDEAGEISDLIIWHFSNHHKPFWWKRICALSNRQCEVVAAFVQTAADSLHRNDGTMKAALEGLHRVNYDG